MSKMPAKKKSCFQITSVTQAQVAASSGADDTESLDDPDESRTEDVSSEIFDVSRRPSGGGGGADLLGACDRSSSEEMLNNVGEQHQEGGHPHHHQGPVNGGFSVRGSAGCSGPVTPHLAGGGVPAGPTASQAPSAPSSTTTTQPMVNSVLHHHHHVTVPANVAPVIPVAATSTTTTSSSSTTTTTTMFNSRFRVIKLDHGSGEPFRRGRWTCTEFYERDSEGSSMSMSRTVDSMKHAVVLDHNNVDNRGDSGLGGGVTTGGSSVVIPGAGGGSAQESNNNNNADSGYSVAYHTHPPEQPPPPQQGYTLASQAGSAGASAFQPSTGGYSTALPQQHPQQANNMQPGVPQNLLHPSGLNGGAPLHGAATTTLHKFPLMPPAAQQFAYSTHGGGGGQLDYRQQQFAALQPHGSNAQNLLSVGPPGAGQGGSSWPSAISPAGVGGGPGMVAQGGGGEAASAVAQQGLMFQLGGGGGGASSVGSVLLATTTTTIAFNSVHNVPATVPNNSMLNHTPGVGGGGGGGFESGRKSDILPQPGALAAKDGGVPFISQRVGGGAPTTVSIFGIPITIDGDEDRNPSTAFYQAFPPSRLREVTKPTNDSTSGASVVAIDNKIEQAMDLVKSHLMYAVREEVEVLKEQIKELFERNSMLERENAVLKSLANTEQLSLVVAAASQAVSVSATSPSSGSMSPPQQQHEQMIVQHHPSTASLGAATNNNSPNASLAPHEGGQQTAPAHHQHGSA